MSQGLAPERVLAAPGFRDLQAFVIGQTGLAYYEKEVSTLALHVAQRIAAARVSGCPAYLELLRESEVEMDHLVALLTVGETYFFRHADAFAALRTVVLPELLERNRVHRSLRIWSAGCANGCEAYSLAILLLQEFGARLRDWTVSIVGTDIDQQALARARAGHFAAWALRSVTDEVRATCFTRVGQVWEIRPEHRQWISFRHGNLALDLQQVDCDSPRDQDLILCRNVMIYFARPTIQRTVSRLHRALTPGGWLLVGPSEHNGEDFRDFRALHCPGVTLYQRGNDSAADTASIWGVQAPRPVSTCRGRSSSGSAPPSLPTPVAANSPATATAMATPAVESDRLRALADGGDYDLALEESDRLLQQGPRDARVHYYRALILGHLQRQDEREQALRKVLYLDRRHELAHFELALLQRNRGDSEGARRSFVNVLRLLEDRQEGERLQSEEITAVELAGLVAAQMNALQEES